MDKLFSVIVLCYNNSELLCECIDSILCQDYAEVELIVADDKSREFDVSFFEKYIAAHKRQNLVSYEVYQNPENYGTVKNCNVALSKAHGKYIKDLAADDVLYSETVLSEAKAALDKSPSGILATDVFKCNKELVPIKLYRNSFEKKLNGMSPSDCFKRLCVHNDIVGPGVFFTRAFFEEFGVYDEHYRLLEDWPKWLDSVNRGASFYFEPICTVKYRADGGIGTSTNLVYLNDKKKVLEGIIKPNKKKIGPVWYVASKLSFAFVNSDFIRKAYGAVFRK